MGHGSADNLLAIADPIWPQILTPVPGQGTNSVFHCRDLTDSGLGGEEGHQRAPGEFLLALAEMLVVTPHSHVCAMNM